MATIAKSNKRALDKSFYVDLDNVAYNQGKSVRDTVELLKSSKIVWSDKDVMKDLSAHFRRGYLAALYAVSEAANVDPVALREHAYKLADAVIETAIASRTPEQTRRYNSAKSAFGHACKMAGMPVVKGTNAGAKRKTGDKPKADDVVPPVAGNAKTSIEGEITIPTVINPVDGAAQAMALANILDRALRTNGQHFHKGINAALRDCVAKVRKLAEVSKEIESEAAAAA